MTNVGPRGDDHLGSDDSYGADTTNLSVTNASGTQL
jgi:hypothetical protein